jgi:DNA repair protein RecN (Recombination protein N)
VPATLRSLRIRNLALVESLDWELFSGFNVVTGETGTGKSVILGALQLVLGERAEKSLIRTGAEQCSVEALFELTDVTEINQQLEEQGIEPCEDGQLLLKRIFSLAGTNRQFVNGSQTTLAVLKQIGDGLVDLHGPHDHQSLLSTDQQLKLVDAFGENAGLVGAYQKNFGELKRLQARQQELQQETSKENLDLWRHQFNELKAANLQAGELQEMEARYKVASNSKKLIETTETILQQLSESESSVLTQLGDVARHLKELQRLDESTSEFLLSQETAMVELEELARSLSAYQGRVDIDPGALQQLEERLNLIQSLQRKYHTDESGLITLTGELTSRLENVDRREELASDLEAEIAHSAAALKQMGEKLTQSRLKASSKLGASVRKHLKDLGFNQAHFEIVTQRTNEPTNHSFETVEFLFAPNPGEPPRALRAIASSGEISRVMLAIKTALAHQDLIGLLVFDEIDANVGGEIAHSVGAKMRSLGENRQVLVITHMPQVAAAASKHFFVTKAISQGRTRTILSEVSGQDRVNELARMLGGKSESAMAHARALLGRG